MHYLITYLTQKNTTTTVTTIANMYNNNDMYDRAKDSMNVTYNQDKYMKKQRQDQESHQRIAIVAFFVVLLLGGIYSIWPSTLTNEEEAIGKCQYACSNTVKFDCERTCKSFESMKKKHKRCVDGCHTFYDEGCYRGCNNEMTVEQCIENSEECHSEYKGLCSVFKIVTKSACGASNERYKNELYKILHH